MRGVDVPNFRNETDKKKQMDIIYQVLLDINEAFQRIQIEDPMPNELRMFVRTKEKLLPVGFKETTGMNGTSKVTGIDEMIITQKL